LKSDHPAVAVNFYDSLFVQKDLPGLYKINKRQLRNILRTCKTINQCAVQKKQTKDADAPYVAKRQALNPSVAKNQIKKPNQRNIITLHVYTRV
jgi:hypothetical protein